MTKLASALLPALAVVTLALVATSPIPASEGVRTTSPLVLEGARVYADNCAKCHAEGVDWELPGCRPESLTGAAQRYSEGQVMNLLDHGVMQMPSFKDMPKSQRQALWAYLSSLQVTGEVAPTRGMSCGRVKAAMAGTPMAGGCGGGGCGGGGCGGGGCGAKAAAAPAPEPEGCGKCEACRGGAQKRLRRGWSFGR